MNWRTALNLLLLACLVGPCLEQCPGAIADDIPAPLGPASNAPPANDVFRIKRDYAPRLYGNIERDKYVPPNQSYVPMTPNEGYGSAVQANDYSGTVNTFQQLPPAVQVPAPPKATYMWGQSAAGGYYDASGKMQGTVMGDELYKFGGTFIDGTPVPTTPVVCNFRGHVYKPYVVKRVP